MRERVAEALERLLILPLVQVQQAYCSQELWALGRELQSLLRGVRLIQRVETHHANRRRGRGASR